MDVKTTFPDIHLTPIEKHLLSQGSHKICLSPQHVCEGEYARSDLTLWSYIEFWEDRHRATESFRSSLEKYYDKSDGKKVLPKVVLLRDDDQTIRSKGADEVEHFSLFMY